MKWDQRTRAPNLAEWLATWRSLQARGNIPQLMNVPSRPPGVISVPQRSQADFHSRARRPSSYTPRSTLTYGSSRMEVDPPRNGVVPQQRLAYSPPLRTNQSVPPVAPASVVKEESCEMDVEVTTSTATPQREEANSGLAPRVMDRGSPEVDDWVKKLCDEASAAVQEASLNVCWLLQYCCLHQLTSSAVSRRAEKAKLLKNVPVVDG